jgi:hypothetical protein
MFRTSNVACISGRRSHLSGASRTGGPPLDVGDDIKRAAHGYEPTREAAMVAKSWRQL